MCLQQFEKIKYTALAITGNEKCASKEWEHEKETKVNSEFLLTKSSGIISYFTSILPDHMTHDSSKKFLTNSHFENRRAGFLLSCHNSLW